MLAWEKVSIEKNRTKVEQEQQLHEAAWRLFRRCLWRYMGLDLYKEESALLYKQEAQEDTLELFLKKEIGRDQFNKPYLIHYPNIYFNISHCEQMVACMIGHKPVGIDVEWIRPFSVAAMKKVCSKEEQEWIRAAHHSEEAFFRLWTLKESYIKAVGKGLQIPMKSITFDLEKIGEIKGHIEDTQKYRFTQKVIEKRFVLALCESL